MRKLIQLLTVIALVAVRALADPLGSATYTMQIDNVTGYMTNGAATAVDQVLTPFGTPFDLAAAGPLAFSGEVWPQPATCGGYVPPSCDPNTNAPCVAPDTCVACATGGNCCQSQQPNLCASDADCGDGQKCEGHGIFWSEVTAAGCSQCGGDCVCQPGCALCYIEYGPYLCSSPDCSIGATSFVSPVPYITGTLVDPLRTANPDLVFTSDGTDYMDGASGTIWSHHGKVGLNAFQQFQTPPGSGVSVPISTTFFDSGNGVSTPVTGTVTYDNTWGTCSNSPATTCQSNADCGGGTCNGGTTTVTAISNAAGAISSHFAVDQRFCTNTDQACTSDADCSTPKKCTGYHAAFFDISTTVGHSGNITICAHYPDNEPKPVGGNGVVDGTSINENALRLMHLKDGVFKDITTSLDPINNVICGVTDSLSPFVIAVDTNIPGGGAVKTDCISEFNAGTHIALTRKGMPKTTVTCHDGDSCDAGGSTPDGECIFRLQVCANVTDPRLPQCTPTDVAQYTLVKPLPDAKDPTDALNASMISEHFGESFPIASATGKHGNIWTMAAPITGTHCSLNTPIYVPLKNGKRASKTVAFKATTSAKVNDTDSITFVCLPPR